MLGLGSNVLAPDEGLDGVTLLLADNFADVEVLPGGLVRAAAGATNAAVAAVARDTGLAGYEFASGIPGTVGGAAIMNAGAYEGQFSDVAVEVRCLVPDGIRGHRERAGSGSQLGLSHQPHDARGLGGAQGHAAVARADSPAAIAARMGKSCASAASKQPLEMPSAGSTFKRPRATSRGAHPRGRLPRPARGRRAGVRKHAGFVVNTGDATAADVLALIAEVQRRVRQTTGVELEPEVRLWQ